MNPGHWQRSPTVLFITPIASNDFCDPINSVYTHCFHEKSNPLDNAIPIDYTTFKCDRNVKSKYILIKLCALVFEYICKRTNEFHEKILFDSGVIFKYR